MKRRIRITASVLAFCALFGLTGKLLRYVLVDDTALYERMTFHEMYEQENIDVLFLGSSICRRAFDPQILDETLQINTFNAGTSGQNMDASLMMIREAVKYNDIEHVYLDLCFKIALNEPYKERTQMTKTYLVSDYLRPSVEKYAYLLNASSSEHYANSFIVARREWQKLFDFEHIKNTIEKKQTDEYKRYGIENLRTDYDTYSDWYVGKGYRSHNSSINSWDYFLASGWDPIIINSISNDWLNDLSDIVVFCEKNDIELTLLCAPHSNFLLTAHGNYDEYVQKIKSLIAGKNIKYYDFNLCREEYFPNTSEVFYDTHHLNQSGSQLFSETFAKLVTGEVSAEEMFYDSYAEKLENLDPTVFGVSYKNAKSDDGQKIRNCKIVTNNDGSFEYQIAVEPTEGDPYILREFSGETTFTMNRSEGICVITYRNVDDIESEYEIRLTMPK